MKGYTVGIQNEHYDKNGKAFFTPLGACKLSGMDTAIRASNRTLLMQRENSYLWIYKVNRSKAFLSGRLLP